MIADPGAAWPADSRNAPDLLALLARISICLIFIQAVMGKIFGWSGQEAYMARHGLSPVAPLLAAALVVEFAGVVCLLLGFQARAAAMVMALYLCLVSVLLHNFWSAQPGQSSMAQGLAQTEFLKNIGIIGGLLMIAAYGPGRFSLAVWWERRRAVS